MDQSTYESFVHCFRMLAVDFMNYETLLICYIYAVLNIKANEDSYDKYDVNSFEFEQMCQRYGMTERPKYIYDIVWFSDFCTELVDHDLQNNYSASGCPGVANFHGLAIATGYPPDPVRVQCRGGVAVVRLLTERTGGAIEAPAEQYGNAAPCYEEGSDITTHPCRSKWQGFSIQKEIIY